MIRTEGTYEGSCFCRRVRYLVTGPLGEMSNCHCTDCRKSHGAPFATSIPVPASQFRFLQGEDELTSYKAASGAIRAFCRWCGSMITWQRDGVPDSVDFTVATLDTPIDQKVAYHIFVRSKASWFDILDDLPQYQAHRPRNESG